jgi:hypothetical protein
VDHEIRDRLGRLGCIAGKRGERFFHDSLVGFDHRILRLKIAYMSVEDEDCLLAFIADLLEGDDLSILFPRECGELLEFVLTGEVAGSCFAITRGRFVHHCASFAGDMRDRVNAKRGVRLQCMFESGDDISHCDFTETGRIAESAIPAAAKTR